MVPSFYIFTILYSFFYFKSSAELITSLPGQPPNIFFKQYSGYIVTNAQHGRALFYYFVEADSENAASLPLTVWLNGGPGCSYVGYGAFMEHGPFRPGIDGSLIKNKYSWNLGNVSCFLNDHIEKIEHAIRGLPVGFSYSNTSSDNINWDDTATAKENLQFILNWFKKFPQYRNSDVYLTGESYAGSHMNWPNLYGLLVVYTHSFLTLRFGN
uniref:Carboxypeptidase n=1 Tax=Nicotiana tabacum TaxID=4097 RepID=A0A1S4DB04_TOBAC|nr:PREDICTED: serine carboxypeptidase-like 40 [Nicotiana tabacum]